MDGLQYQWLLDNIIDMERCYQTFFDLIVTSVTAHATIAARVETAAAVTRSRSGVRAPAEARR
jgi:hypothetical protein